MTGHASVNHEAETCQFFEASGEGDIVLGCPNPVGEGPLFFFVPLPDGNAVRVPVCEQHAEWLREKVGRDE